MNNVMEFVFIMFLFVWIPMWLMLLVLWMSYLKKEWKEGGNLVIPSTILSLSIMLMLIGILTSGYNNHGRYRWYANTELINKIFSDYFYLIITIFILLSVIVYMYLRKLNKSGIVTRIIYGKTYHSHGWGPIEPLKSVVRQVETEYKKEVEEEKFNQHKEYCEKTWIRWYKKLDTQWNTNICDECLRASEMWWIYYDEVYSNWFLHAPFHENCRCNTLYHLWDKPSFI